MLRLAAYVGGMGWLVEVEWEMGSKKVYWWMESLCSKAWMRLVRVVTAPVWGLSKRVWRSCFVVAQGFAELTRGGFIRGSGIVSGWIGILGGHCWYERIDGLISIVVLFVEL